MQSTIQLFRRLCDNLPPLFPEETAQKMRHALDDLENNSGLTEADAEKTITIFGYEVWPWNMAYREFFSRVENNLGEHFLLPKLSADLRGKYDDFKIAGGQWDDLRCGNPTSFFSTSERLELCAALVTVGRELKTYLDGELSGLKRGVYQARVDDFGRILSDIRLKLEEMNAMADAEQEHPQLAREIRQRVRLFEQGLCQLAPPPDYRAVCESVDFFCGRKEDLNRLRGANVPVEVDFYSI